MTETSATSAAQSHDPLSRAISISVSLHCALFAIFFLKMTFFPSQPIEIKRAMRVDLVGLPEKTQTLPPVEAPAAPAKVETPAPAAPPAPTPAPPPKVAEAPKVPTKDAKPKPDTKKLEKSQTSAMERIKQMEALSKLEQQQKEAQAKAAAAAAAAAAAQVRGNQLSKGNSLTGLEQIEYDRYFDQIEKTVHANWAVPEWLNSAQLKAQVQVLIDKTGHVTSKKITKSSGNETFDAEVLEAIEKSSPFPQPPARLQGVLANSGIVFNFPD